MGQSERSGSRYPSSFNRSGSCAIRSGGQYDVVCGHLGKDNVQYHLPAHEVVARCMINVHVQDYTGNPIEGLEVVRSYQNYIEQNYYHQFYTDEKAT
jgi:hypothetical protein